MRELRTSKPKGLQDPAKVMRVELYPGGKVLQVFYLSKINEPAKLVIDNEARKNAIVIRVDNANKNGILLEVVQILSDLNLIILKAYISSDGGWFMDVFNVSDQDRKKVTDEGVLDYIRKYLGPESCFTSSMGLNHQWTKLQLS